MIILVHGNVFEKIKKKTNQVVASLQKKRPQAETVFLNDETLSSDSLQEVIGTSGLFERKLIVVLKGVLTNKETKGVVSDYLKELKDSDNVFVFSEGEIIPKTFFKKIEKYSQVVYEEGEIQTAKKSFSPFSLTDALGRRDPKKLWTLYQKALQENIPTGELHGILFWQVKSMIVAKRSKSAKESGLKPFVFSKAKKFSENFSDEELLELSFVLVKNYHESRRGHGSFDAKLERFILSL